MLIYWVWFSLLSIPNFIKKTLLEACGDPKSIYEGRDIPEDMGAKLRKLDLQDARAVMEKCREKELKIIPYSHSAYPDALRQIPDPPMVLYLRGKLPDLSQSPAIGVVGTRKCTPAGEETAYRISAEIAACGGIVVTGMAFGIDAQAAWGALSAGKPVIGVLGCGADVVYPKGNAALFDAVLETGGILSEYPPETTARNFRFPERNRIISGLSCGTLVVEAPEKSGALITASCALEQGRDVFVVPGAVSEKASKGSNQLLRQGAAAVFSGWDVVSEYAARYAVSEVMPPKKTKNAKVFVPSTGKKQDKTEKTEKIIIDKEEQSPYSEPVRALPSLTPAEETLLGLIPAEGILTDDVVRQSGMQSARIFTALTMLEIKGLIRRLPGNRIARVRGGK